MEKTIDQLPLPFPHHISFLRQDFFVSETNYEAFHCIDQWPEWPFYLLTVYGPEGCGKTHLAHLFANKSKATFWNPEQSEAFLSIPMMERHSSFVIDNIHAALDTIDPAHFFHFLNLTREHGKHVLITANSTHKHWNIPLPDLKSRLASSLSIGIKSPDDTLLKAVLIKQFSDQQLIVPRQVIDFLLKRMPRSMKAAREIVIESNKKSLARKQQITIHFMREILETINTTPIKTDRKTNSTYNAL